MISKVRIAAAVAIHAGLIYFFRHSFVWYGLNSVKNPYYNFSLFFIGLWLVVQYLNKVVMPAQAGIQSNLDADWIPAFAGMTKRADYPVIGLATGIAAWAAYIIWRGPYFALVCFLLTSLLTIRWASKSFSERIDGLYCAVFFTLPFPFYAELLSLLQIFTLRVSLIICRLSGLPLENEGSLVFLKDGPVRIAAACSGFQSLIVLFALAGMIAYFARLTFLRKFLMLLLSIAIAVGFNIARVSAMLAVGKIWDVSTAFQFWHGLSAWLFYALALGSMAAVGMCLKPRR